jgi:hypothetical protein
MRTYNANNKSVFVSVVFVLVLGDQSLTGIVVGLTLCDRIFNIYFNQNYFILITSSSSVFNLEALEVSLVLDNFNEWLNNNIN